MISAIAIDDEPLSLSVIQAFCSQMERIKLEETFTDTTMALKYVEVNPVSLLFLDINMPSISGIDFYKMLPRDVMVIFTTAYSKYAAEGFNLNATDYLVKPFSFARFKQAVEKAIEYHDFKQRSVQQTAAANHIFIKADYSVMKVDCDDIIYIEGLDNYLKIHLKDKKPIIARMSMKGIMEKLPGEFKRVHRSYIVPFNKVDSIRNKIIYLGGHEIPVGANYTEEVQSLFKSN